MRKKVATTTSTLSLLTHRLARHVALLDHHLLREEDLLGRDLHAEVAARDHHAVGLCVCERGAERRGEGWWVFVWGEGVFLGCARVFGSVRVYGSRGEGGARSTSAAVPLTPPHTPPPHTTHTPTQRTFARISSKFWMPSWFSTLEMILT